MAGVIPRLVKVGEHLWVDPDSVEAVYRDPEAPDEGTIVVLHKMVEATESPIDSVAAIINALRNSGFDPVMIKMAARDTGLNMGEVDIALAPAQDTPAPLPTSLGLTPGKNASPSTP